MPDISVLQSILLIALIVLCVSIVYLIIKLSETVKRVNLLIVKNEKYMEDTMENVALTTKNLEEITTDLNDEMEGITHSLQNVMEAVDNTSESVNQVNEDVLRPILEIGSIISIIKDFIPTKKKKGFFK